MIFIIGGKGFLGSAIARLCAATGREHVVIDRMNYQDYRGARCDVLINANGNSKKFLSREAPLEDFAASVATVRATLADIQYGSYVLLSSCDVYPDSSSPATSSEDQVLQVERQSAYGFHKYLAEQCVRHAAREWLIFRGGGFVGPGLRKNPVYDIMHGQDLWMTADSELQYLHTDRAAQIVMDLVDRGVRNEIFNLSGRGVIRLDRVMEYAGRQVGIRPGSQRFRCEIDLHNLARLIELPETDDAVRQFVQAEMPAIRREEEASAGQ